MNCQVHVTLGQVSSCITCDLGLINGGRLAEWRALSKMREIRLVLVSRAAYVTAKPTPTPKRCTPQTNGPGLASMTDLFYLGRCRKGVRAILASMMKVCR